LTGQEVLDAFWDELEAGIHDKPLMMMIAGPNGAGKTTLWKQHLEHKLGQIVDEYINADMIERELNWNEEGSPQTEETARAAQREATSQREACRHNQSFFIFETVFSDTEGHKLNELDEGVKGGHFVVMVFIGLNDLELAMQRVQQRVAQGGHDVLPQVQSKRFPRVYQNAAQAVSRVPLALFLDNSRDVHAGRGTHRPVAVFLEGVMIACIEDMPDWWSHINQDDCLA
jgi:predicted ABC-type ATPase